MVKARGGAWADTEIPPCLEGHGCAETGLGTEKPMVKPLSNRLRQLSLPRPKHSHVSYPRAASQGQLYRPTRQTMICFFHCQDVVESGSLFVSGRGCLSIPCQRSLSQDLPARPSLIDVAHPPKVDPEACLVRTSDDLRLGPHHRPPLSAVLLFLEQDGETHHGHGELDRVGKISSSKTKKCGRTTTVLIVDDELRMPWLVGQG